MRSLRRVENGKKAFSTKRVMLLGAILLLLGFPSSTTMLSMRVIENARFDPIDSIFRLINASSVSSQLNCLCQCSTNSMCVTATYFGVSQLCSLFSAQLWQGQLTLVTTNQQTSTLTFRNKNITGQ